MSEDVASIIPRGIVTLAKLLRWAHLNGVVRSVRTRASLELFRQLHEQVIHNSRELGVRMEDWNLTQVETTNLAKNVCTASTHLLSNLLELKSGHLHCCIKVLLPPTEKDSTPNNAQVATWIRSEPYDARPNDKTLYHVSDNSVWSSLLGCNDGKFDWEIPYSCFACNDLYAHESFRNSRANWRNYYRSALVFPIRYMTHEEGQAVFNVMGFLAFDAPNKRAFDNVPDIYDYKDDLGKRAEYFSLLSNTTVFQVGAVIADTLSMFLRPAYANHSKKKDL